MDMYEYFNKLNQLAGSNQNNKLLVDNDLVDIANQVTNNYTINDAKDAFLYFAALNYLNSVVKIDHSISYKFKSLVQNGVNAVLNKKIYGISMYYNICEKVTFISFANFIFSFHFVQLDSSLTKILMNQQIIKFDGIRKHPCGDLIFKEALKIKKIYFSQTRNDNYSKSDDINNIIQTYNLDQIVTNENLKRNIAIVLLQLHYIDDHIINDNIPQYLNKAFYRDIIILSFSVLEALELEIGAKILRERTDKIYLSNKDRIDNENRFRKAYSDNINMDSETKKYFSNYKFKRNNVHLSKQQVIEFDDDYSKEKVVKFLVFMEEYMNFMVDFVKNKRL